MGETLFSGASAPLLVVTALKKMFLSPQETAGLNEEGAEEDENQEEEQRDRNKKKRWRRSRKRGGLFTKRKKRRSQTKCHGMMGGL